MVVAAARDDAPPVTLPAMPRPARGAAPAARGRVAAAALAASAADARLAAGAAAEATASAALRLAFLHARLHPLALLGRHARHALFHALAPLLGRHVRIEAAPAAESASAALAAAGGRGSAIAAASGLSRRGTPAAAWGPAAG